MAELLKLYGNSGWGWEKIKKMYMVKRKRGIYEFDPVVYPFLLWVTISDDFDKALTGYECMDDSMLPDVKPDAGVFRVIRESDRRWGIMVVYNSARSITYGTAAHEAMHVLVQVYDVIGADIRQDETPNYLLGWVADCIGSVREKYG